MVARGVFMKSRFTFLAKLLVLGLTALCSTRAAAGAPDGSIVYDIADLGTLGGPTSGASRINNRGQIVGSSTLPGAATTHAFLYSEGRMTDLGTLAGGNSRATAINDSAQVAGNSDGTAFLYQDGAMQDLGTLGGGFSIGSGINSAGWVVGASPPNFLAGQHAFVFCIGETIDLGTLGGAQSFANGINDAGQVVGSSFTAAEDFSHAFLYDGSMIDLGRGTALAINRTGQVTGFNGSNHLFLYDGVMHDLGTLDGASSIEPSSINDAGKIVGTAQSGSGLLRAFFYDGTRIVDLNNLIPQGSRWCLSQARGINNSDQIVGNGNHAGRDHAFLLTPRRQSRE